MRGERRSCIYRRSSPSLGACSRSSNTAVICGRPICVPLKIWLPMPERGGREDLEETLISATVRRCWSRCTRNFTATSSIPVQVDMKQAALSYYPVISNLFYDELGERLSPELRDIYLWASQERTR